VREPDAAWSSMTMLASTSPAAAGISIACGKCAARL
jgi:hypothetical protein